MRLDKYLKVSQLIRRRTVAKDVAESHHIEVNGKTAKPSKELKEGDIITIKYASRELSVKVLSLDKNTSKKESPSMYEVIE